jgi:Zn-dependent metalloprotease
MKQSLLALLALILMMIGLAVPPTNAQPARPRPPHNARPILDQIERDRGSIEVVLDPETNTPAYLHGSLGTQAGRAPLATTLAFFTDYGAAWGIAQPEQTLRLIAHETDGLGYTSLRFEQQLVGYPVLDTDLRAQINRDGVLETINGRLVPDMQLPALRPNISSAAAVQRAQQQVGGTLQEEPRVGLARIGGIDYLVWEIWLLDKQRPARWRMRLNALDGNVLDRIDVLHSARDRKTYDAEMNTFLPGTLTRSEATPPVADEVVNAAHDHAKTVYDYMYGRFRRDSIDNAGMTIISTVHFAEGYNNAFWDGSQIVYGDGDGRFFAPLAQSLDVVAHELTHGITERTAGLYYSQQPGALNESFSDIFGILIDTANWEIGETVYTPETPGDALRSAADPTRYGDPSVWGEYLYAASSNDNGAIHSNSGILNHIAYELATTIGRDKTAQIFYRTLTQKLTANSDFLITRNLTIQACQELIGTVGMAPRDCEDVRMAFIRAGIGLSSKVTPPKTAPYQIVVPLVLQGNSGLSSRLTLPELPRCGTELVQNGTFEAGHNAWPTDSPTPAVVAGNSMIGGNHSARLTIGYQALQWVRVPPGAQTAAFHFNIYRAGPAAPSTQETFYVRTETSDGLTHTDVLTMTGAQPLNQWINYSTTLDVHNVRDLRLVFQNRYGAQHVDNVSLIAECGR